MLMKFGMLTHIGCGDAFPEVRKAEKLYLFTYQWAER